MTPLPRAYDYSYDGSRSRVRAAGASGWALRRRRGRARDPVQGRCSAQVAGLPAKHRSRPCSQRRAGPRQKGLPTNAWPSQKTSRRALLAAGGERRNGVAGWRAWRAVGVRAGHRLPDFPVSLAHRHTVRRGKPHPVTGDANRFEASLAPALASLLQPLRPQPRMWRSCPRLPEDRLIGHTCQSRRARVAREAVGAEGQVVPQQWLAHTTATGVPADDRRRFDLVVSGATANGEALCATQHRCPPLQERVTRILAPLRWTGPH